MKFKIGDEVFVQDFTDEVPYYAVIKEVTIDGGYYVKISTIESTLFYYDYEMRKLTKLEKALK